MLTQNVQIILINMFFFQVANHHDFPLLLMSTVPHTNGPQGHKLHFWLDQLHLLEYNHLAQERMEWCRDSTSGHALGHHIPYIGREHNHSPGFVFVSVSKEVFTSKHLHSQLSHWWFSSLSYYHDVGVVVWGKLWLGFVVWYLRQRFV